MGWALGMVTLFLDEFGHPEPYNPEADAQTYNPVFGYGGIVLPAENVAAFATHFFDIKTYAMRNVLINKQISEFRRDGKPDERFEKQQHLKNLKHDQIVYDRVLRRLCSKYKVKGDEVFSRYYVEKLKRKIREGTADEASEARDKLRAFFRYMKWFFRVLEEHDARIVFYGVDKRLYWPNRLHNPHVKFVEQTLEIAFELAKKNNTTAAVYFDRHRSDGIEDEYGRRSAGRMSRAREIILQKGMVEHITEPVLPFHAVESQCMQAADWVCYLLAQTFPYHCNKKTWVKYKEFFEVVDPLLARNTCYMSEFRFASGKSYGRHFQGELDLPPTPQPPRPPNIVRRPYHDYELDLVL